MKKTIIYSIMAMMLLFATSCEDVLDQKAVDAFNEESVFEDINLTKAYLGRCYDYIGVDNNMLLGLREDILAGATDEVLCIHRPGEYTNIKGTMSPDQLGHFGNWRFNWITWSLYGNIKNVNIFLANIDNVPIETSSDEVLLPRMKGEAYFIRAFDYVNLMRSYGGVVLIDEPFELDQDFLSVQRSSIDETLDFILADLDQAISLLPEKDGIEQGRATKGAAAALKSRILSWSTGILMNGGYQPSNPLVSFQSGSRTQRLEAAKTAAKAVIDGQHGHYALAGTTDDPPAEMTEEVVMQYADNFFSIFTQKGEWNDEAIWGVQHLQSQGNTTTQNRWWGPNGYHNWGNNGPNEPVVRKFEMANGEPFQFDKYDPGNTTVREFTAEELAEDPERNPYVGREPRFYATVFFDGAQWMQRPSDGQGIDPEGRIQTGYFMKPAPNEDEIDQAGLDTRQSFIESWNGTKNGYYLKKYQDPATVGQHFNNENAWIEMRYAEVLLDYAEACIELGGDNLQEGLDALNRVRNRAGLPDRVTSDQDQAREWYRKERQLEMFAEGDRWYMMRKWMIADEVIEDVYHMKIYHYADGSKKWFYDTAQSVDDRQWNDSFYWLPISRTEMNKAPQLQQNPGYN
ncbi:RagB/SusD family nutrient uptake outer membrane protein [Tangfeifania diversioriginum]|nr:RagB/SusD family nutrient uptake outer membrane protein [Tangfeifania diversioriginum]